MKFVKLYLFGFCAFCGCADATSGQKIAELTCPYILPSEKDFPANWVTIGKSPSGRLQLRETSIIDGNAKDEKERVLKLTERIFSRDIIDEWDDFEDRSEATAEYPENHREMAMMCTYSRTELESFDNNLNVVVLIPLPSKKTVNCLLTRRDVDPTHEISCKVK